MVGIVNRWQTWLIALIILALAAGVAFFWFSGERYTPPEPVKMTTEDVKRPELVAAQLNLEPKVAREVVREVVTVEKPIIVYKDVPADKVPEKVTEAVKIDKPDKVIVTEEKRDVSVYSIHLENKTRFGIYGKMSAYPEVKPVEAGVMVKKGDELFMVGKDFERDRINVAYGRFF